MGILLNKPGDSFCFSAYKITNNPFDIDTSVWVVSEGNHPNSGLGITELARDTYSYVWKHACGHSIRFSERYNGYHGNPSDIKYIVGETHPLFSLGIIQKIIVETRDNTIHDFLNSKLEDFQPPVWEEIRPRLPPKIFKGKIINPLVKNRDIHFLNEPVNMTKEEKM